jgi:hypothetical protein
METAVKRATKRRRPFRSCILSLMIQLVVLTTSITSHSGQSDPGKRLEPVVGACDLVESVPFRELSRLTRRSTNRSKVEMSQEVGELSVLPYSKKRISSVASN